MQVFVRLVPIPFADDSSEKHDLAELQQRVFALVAGHELMLCPAVAIHHPELQQDIAGPIDQPSGERMLKGKSFPHLA